MISIIVAVAANRVIGCDNRLIWHISEDLKRFKRITSGHPVVMGRKTFESLGRPLPNRHNVVVTRSKELVIDGVTVVNSLNDAVNMFDSNEEVFIIGGGEIYEQSMGMADKLYITKVDQTPDGDTLFPEVDLSIWRETLSEEHEGYTFLEYCRAKADIA